MKYISCAKPGRSVLLLCEFSALCTNAPRASRRHRRVLFNNAEGWEIYARSVRSPSRRHKSARGQEGIPRVFPVSLGLRFGDLRSTEIALPRIARPPATPLIATALIVRVASGRNYVRDVCISSPPSPLTTASRAANCDTRIIQRQSRRSAYACGFAPCQMEGHFLRCNYVRITGYGCSRWSIRSKEVFELDAVRGSST